MNFCEAARLHRLSFLFICTNILIFRPFQDYLTDVEGHYLCMYDFPVPSITCLYFQTYWLVVVPLICIKSVTNLPPRLSAGETRYRISHRKRKTFVLLSRIGLETNTNPMIHFTCPMSGIIHRHMAFYPFSEHNEFLFLRILASI